MCGSDWEGVGFIFKVVICSILVLGSWTVVEIDEVRTFHRCCSSMEVSQTVKPFTAQIDQGWEP